ncbi:hypothetical protein [Haloprofundus halophilus]|uniref:hypothetical protein n=1 Tax=Haloprofundus halophilus TaxID=2283527 RepID=UPI000E43B862|nr:hypothetical protein [Haloprofundus halophilus]
MATKQTETVLSQHLTTEQYTKVTDIAAEEGCSVDDLLADIVDEYVTEYEADDRETSGTERPLHPQTRVGRHSSYF